jgi:putative ABC transport system substrate-binding protein
MGMKRRDFVAMIVGGATVSPLIARAEQGTSIPRIGYIDPETRSAGIQGLLAGLEALGYVDGRNIKLIKSQFAAPTAADMRAAILAIIREVDVLVVSGTVGGVAAKSVTSEVPVVFISVGAPVDIGLVKSLAKPGGNMTGISFEAAEETYAKRLQLLKEIVPDVSHVAILGAAGDPNFGFAMTSLKRSAPSLGVSITPFEIESADELGQAFDEMKRAQAQAVLVVAGYLTYSSIKKTADLALNYHLPSCHGFKEAAPAGALISLGPDLVSLGRQGSRLVDKIIRGERPADIPVEQPDRYVMSINLKTARLLGITVPPSLIAGADEVIE